MKGIMTSVIIAIICYMLFSTMPNEAMNSRVLSVGVCLNVK